MENKEKKKRSDWEERPVKLAILKYLLTSANVPTALQKVDVPASTFKEK